MKIRHKLILYFGILLVLCFSIAGLLTAYFIHGASNRLLFSNVSSMNAHIAASISTATESLMIDDMEDIKRVTGVETILILDGAVVFSTFADEAPLFENAVLASEKYGVYGVRTGTMFYYYTIAGLSPGDYTLYVFRSEDLAVFEGEGIFFASFVGVVFLFVSISALSIFAARVFARPIRALAGYANRMDPEGRPEPRPIFDIDEFNELAGALEKAAVRLNDYRVSESEFLHNFSHEMKTPLTNIYGYAEGINCGVLQGEDAQTATKVIMAESEKLKDNINQILFLGRLDAVENDMKMQKTNVADMIADAMNQVQLAAKDASVELRFEPPAAECYLTGDAEKLEAAFANVISNGVRYAKSAITIAVDARPDRILVTVDDDGPGIPVADRERVFERYFIGYKGHTGLGLTITRAIVAAHGGTVTASESPACGARFTFDLPKRSV